MTQGDHAQRAIEPLLRAAFGAQSAQLLYVAVKLGVADALGAGPKTVQELASLLAVDTLALGRVLRGLVVLGVCNEEAGWQFGLTALGDHLRTDHPESVAPRVVLNVELHHALWADLLGTVKTGESASQRVLGAPFYEYLARNPAMGAVFDKAMSGGGWIEHRLRAAIDAYDFGKFRSIVDIGGGNGSLMVETLTAYPQITGTVFDVPRLAEVVESALASAGLTHRCDFVAGNAFETVPAGRDAYILSNFVNSWSDDDVLVVLRNCRAAMPSTGRLLLLEWVIPSDNAELESFRAWDTVTMDIVMLAAFGARGGRLRTRAEFESLLHAAGFAVKAFTPTRASIFIIEGEPS